MFSDVGCQTTFAQLEDVEAPECIPAVNALNVDDYSEVQTKDLHGVILKPPHCFEPRINDDVEFPSLEAAASHSEKKHSSLCSASQARKFRKCRQRTSDSVGSIQHTFTEDQSQLEAAGYSVEAPESIPACNAFVECEYSAPPVQNGIGVWKELRRHSSDTDVDVPQRRKVLSDRETERPVTGISSTHSSRPLAPVSLGDFIAPNQLSDSDNEQPFGFSSCCTRCGDPTHRYNECSRALGDTFCD